MKKYLFLFLTLLSSQLYAQTFTSGYVFTAGETNVTHTKLNTMISGMTVSGIPGSSIANSTISTANLANNSVTSAKILDSTIVSADVMPRGLAGTELATNSVSGIELNTNLVIRAGFWTHNAGAILSFTNATIGFSTNQIASGMVNGTSVSAGAADAGKVVRLNASGVLDSTMTPFSASFTSSQQTVTFGSTLTVAHGLSSTPTLVQVQLVCITTDVNYAVGDVIGNLSIGDANNIGVTVSWNGTNVIIKTASNGIYLADSGAAFVNAAITAAKWKYVIKAWL